MLGAIIGDIVGSRFEFNPTNDYNFELFTPQCSYTDDTICTIAIADALLKDRDFGESLHEWCNRYPHPMGGYGGSFAQWVHSPNPQPYNSFGNGAAMRVSPIAWFGLNAIGDICRTEAATACTHNHPEGIKGAQSVMTAIHDCLQLHFSFLTIDRDTIYEHGLKRAVELFGYNINLSLNEVQNRFDETCQGTVPVAYWIIMQSNSFEDAIRRAVSLGADADTLGAIVGSIAEAIWGIPEWMKKKAISYLPQDMRDVLQAFRKACPWKLTQRIKQNQLRASLLASCRFYKGEEENPFEQELDAHEVDKSHLPPPECMHTEYQGLTNEEIDRLECSATAWKYERMWVEMSQKKDDFLLQMEEEYINHGLSDLYPYDGVAISLKALLFNRYCHWGYTDPDGFRKWYTHAYHPEIEQQEAARAKEREERKQELLKKTLFYKGEDTCPEAILAMNGMCGCYWDYERVWVQSELDPDEDYTNMVSYFQTNIQKNKPIYKPVPLGLQAIFANRIEHWAGDGVPPTLESVTKFCYDYERAFSEYKSQLIIDDLHEKLKS